MSIWLNFLTPLTTDFSELAKVPFRINKIRFNRNSINTYG